MQINKGARTQNKHEKSYVSRKIMRFSFPTNVYREEKKLVMYAFSYVYMDTLLSIYFATLITREEKTREFQTQRFNT